MKLNMGCGLHRFDGFINVDKYPECAPDQVVDLESFPWPWEDNSATVVVFSHSLEHMGESTDCFLRIMQELWRICADGATIEIVAPHPRHDDYVGDPTHVRIILPDTLSLFSREENLKWQRDGVSNTPLALYTGTDFELVEIQAGLEEPWSQRFESGELSWEQIRAAARDYNNVIKQHRMVLKVRKSTPG